MISSLLRRTCVECAKRLSKTGIPSLSFEQDTKQYSDESCYLCLGLLTKLRGEELVNQAKNAVKESGTQCTTFRCSLFTKNICDFREALLVKYAALQDEKNYEPCESLKEVWRNFTFPLLESALDAKFQFDSPLELQFILECNDFEDNLKLKKDYLRAKRKWVRHLHEFIVSKPMLVEYVATLQMPEIIKFFEHSTLDRCEVTVKVKFESLFLAGRYIKYSRCLPQTPWYINGKKMRETSIQELITDEIKPVFKSNDVLFLSAGREDVDVLTLGLGRPFAVEIKSSCVPPLSNKEVEDLQDRINKSTSLIQVRDLQHVTKEEVKLLKEGEEEKTKVYSAICFSTTPLCEEDMRKISGIKDLVIKQRTPIRVLQRRALLDRERTIHNMEAELIDECTFKIRLETQAGTYIKEFVHSDLGRTSPSISSILQKEIDIMELTVEAIKLDFPPIIERKEVDR